MLKRYLKLSIIWTTILTTLSASSTFAGNWLAMPGVLQLNWAGGVLRNWQESIIFGMKDSNSYIQYHPYHLLNDFWLEKIWNFYRGEKRFIGNWGVQLRDPGYYHYPSYTKPQEWSWWRTRVYGVWEAQWWKYNLYDANGSKWGDCVPYYISGSNRYNQIHNGSISGTMAGDSFTTTTHNYILNNTVSINPYYSLIRNQGWSGISDFLKFYTPDFLWLYGFEELWMQMYIPYVVNEMWQRQSKINLISNAWHLNGDLNPEHVDFTFSFY